MTYDIDEKSRYQLIQPCYRLKAKSKAIDFTDENSMNNDIKRILEVTVQNVHLIASVKRSVDFN